MLTITSPFGERHHPTLNVRRPHNGADIRAPQGTLLRAVWPGTVVRATDPLAGIGLVEVEHPWGARTRYLHLSEVAVRAGDQVTPAIPIGRSGGTPGTPGAGASTGPHLHFELLRWDGSAWTPVDPEPLLRSIP